MGMGLDNTSNIYQGELLISDVECYVARYLPSLSSIEFDLII